MNENARPVDGEVLTAQDVAGEAYQVIAAIADLAGLLFHPAVQRALDYFSGDLAGEILPLDMTDA